MKKHKHHVSPTEHQSVSNHVKVTGKIETSSPDLLGEYKAARIADGDHEKKKFKMEVWTLVGILLTAIFAFWQGCSTRELVVDARDNFIKDQRAWISITAPKQFPYRTDSIGANIQLSDSGKTPAKKVTAEFVATTIEKGVRPSFDQYGVGHPHNKLYAGAIYPGAQPVEVPINVVKYGDKSQVTIIPDAKVQKDIQDGNLFIVCFGKVSYCDTFGVKHWTKFCSGNTGSLGIDWVKDCVAYNDVDVETAPSPECQ
jgi:hypothetical protein